MIFWMAKTARHLSGDLRSKIDAAAEAGRWSLAVVALLAVGREGLETSLFLWAATNAATADGTTGNTTPLIAALLGILVACLMGYLFYRGAVRINLTRFFTWTGFFLILVAAGVLSYGVHDLQEAGVLPGLHNLAFDVSDVIEPGSVLGALLKGVLNFSPATTWLEATAWLLYVVPVAAAFYVVTRRRTPTSGGPGATDKPAPQPHAA
jgi:high-affinity iron transporter